MSKYTRFVVIDSYGDFAQSYSAQLSCAESFAKWCAFITQGTAFAEYEASGETKHKKIWDYREAQAKKQNN